MPINVAEEAKRIIALLYEKFAEFDGYVDSFHLSPTYALLELGCDTDSDYFDEDRFFQDVIGTVKQEFPQAIVRYWWDLKMRKGTPNEEISVGALVMDIRESHQEIELYIKQEKEVSR